MVIPGPYFNVLNLIGDARKIVYQVQEDLQDMRSRLAYMDTYLDLFEDERKPGDLYTAWKEREESVRQYFHEVDRIVNKFAKNSGKWIPVIVYTKTAID